MYEGATVAMPVDVGKAFLEIVLKQAVCQERRYTRFLGEATDDGRVHPWKGCLCVCVLGSLTGYHSV